MAAMYVIENGAGTYYSPQTDHLGSILKVFDYSGNIVAEQSFDAWGRRRNPSNWTYNNIPTVPKWLIRGYTGHEHLDENGLINMNGRMYDPILGRMLSPDNYVQAADFSQNYNRYSYVLNNPLKYNDPSGELWDLVLGVAGGYLGGVAANDGNFNPLQWDYDDSNTWMMMYEGAKLGYTLGAGLDAHLAQKALIDPHGNINPNLLASNDDVAGKFVLNEMQVTASRKYSIFIDPITPSSLDPVNIPSFWSNTGTAAAMTLMWATGFRLPFGAGSYYNNDKVANAMRNAWKVNEARDFFYKKYKGVSDLSGASVTNYKGNFGLEGIYRAGMDPIEQFVGSYRVDMNVIENKLQIKLTNNTSVKSLLYGKGPEWNGGPFGNFEQTYIFTESLR